MNRSMVVFDGRAGFSTRTVGTPTNRGKPAAMRESEGGCKMAPMRQAPGSGQPGMAVPLKLASLGTREDVAGHLNFDISTFLDDAFMGGRAKTGALVEPLGAAVALDDF